MNWGEIKESKAEYPEVIVESTFEGFSTATQGLANLYITELEDTLRLTSGLKRDFQFAVYLGSDHLTSYSFQVFSFGYNIQLRPVLLRVESLIFEEIEGHPIVFGDNKIELSDDNDLKAYLERIYATQRFLNVVGGVMKLARKKKDEDTHLY
ncbi:MAG: hypothetical protein JSS76_19655 [Bacteroidetes bacterium]|nr:hypothetical protein [Bacteroidota bacterium]